MTPEEVRKVEALVNEAIARDLPVHYEEMSVDEARARGAIGLFEERYGESAAAEVLNLESSHEGNLIAEPMIRRCSLTSSSSFSSRECARRS